MCHSLTVTHFFMNMGTMMGGAVLVENVFKYPGLGTMMRSAIAMRDYTLIQGIFLFMTVIVLLLIFPSLSFTSTNL